MLRKFTVPLLICFLSITASLSGCSRSPDSSQVDPEQTLRIAIGAAPQSLDPHQVSGTPAIKVLSALFEPLLLMNPVTVTPEPGVAQSWSITDNGKHYRFEIRPDAKWSDGSPITAHDFVFTWKRILSPGIAHNFAQDFYAIDGARRFHQSKTDDFSTVGVKADGDGIVEFFLERPDPLFLKRLTHESTLPVQEKTILAHGPFDDPISKWTQPPNLISNGPFMLTGWELNKTIVAVKNPHYWGADSVKLEKIIFTPVEHDATTERMFRAGQLQFEYGGAIPEEKIAYYRENDPDKLVIKPGYATYFYDFNTQKAPFDNVNVRRAFAFSVDRQLIVDRIKKAGQQPALTISPTNEHYNPETNLSFDPDKARAFLAQAGFPNGEGFPAVTLKYNTHDGHRKVAVALQQMWKQHLNVDVQLENQEWKVFLVTRRQHDFDIARDGWSSTYADPLDMLSIFESGHDLNSSAWKNPQFDALFGEAKIEQDFNKRMELMAQAEKIVLDQVPVIPIYFYSYSYLIAPEVKGMQFGAIEKADYKPIYIDTSAKGK